MIAVLPFFHTYGLVVVMNLSLSRGATVVTMPRFDVSQFLRAVQDYRITRAHVVPPIVLALVKHPLVDGFDLSSLKFINSAPISQRPICTFALPLRSANCTWLRPTPPT